jgi:hypothetical protein
MLSLPEYPVVITALAPTVGAGAAINATPISLKYVHKLWAKVDVNTASTSAAVAIVPQTDDLVAFGSAAALATAVPIWACVDIATTPNYVEATAAVNYTTVGDALSKSIIFLVDPSGLAAGEDCFRIRFTSVAASDLVAVTYIIEPRYAAAVASQVSFITD